MVRNMYYAAVRSMVYTEPVMIRVIVVDDHTLVREGLNSVFRRTDDIRMVADYADGVELLNAAPTTDDADVIILDIAMAKSSGLDVARTLKDRGNAPPVLFLTLHPEASHLSKALESGARGFLNKSRTQDTLSEAVRIVAGGGLYLSEAATALLWDDPVRGAEREIPRLSGQEEKVLRMICDGIRQKEIASRMGISIQTVSTYKHRIMEKFGVTTTVELIRTGLEFFTAGHSEPPPAE